MRYMSGNRGGLKHRGQNYNPLNVTDSYMQHLSLWLHLNIRYLKCKTTRMAIPQTCYKITNAKPKKNWRMRQCIWKKAMFLFVLCGKHLLARIRLWSWSPRTRGALTAVKHTEIGNSSSTNWWDRYITTSDQVNKWETLDLDFNHLVGKTTHSRSAQTIENWKLLCRNS